MQVAAPGGQNARRGWPQLSRHVRRPALPANESLRHFILKWAAYHVLTHDLGCPFAFLEAGAGRSRSAARHDALGVRFSVRRAALPWRDVEAGAVRLEVLDGATGAWRQLSAGELAPHLGDPTLRAFERGPGGLPVPLRAVAPGRGAGLLRVRGSGSERRQTAQLCAADAKQARGDLQAWLREAPRRLRGVQLFMLVTPPGLAEPAELPARVGLAEVDLECLRGAAGRPAIRVARWPEPLRPAAPWSAERTAEFQRRAYYALHGLFQRQIFWFLAQEALDRRRASLAARPPTDRPTAAGADGAAGGGGRHGRAGGARPSGG